MADDDDDWETDADYVNDLTEEQQRAFGNKETMEKYNNVMDKTGDSVVGASRVELNPRRGSVPTHETLQAEEVVEVEKRAAPTPLNAAPPPAFALTPPSGGPPKATSAPPSASKAADAPLASPTAPPPAMPSLGLDKMKIGTSEGAPAFATARRGSSLEAGTPSASGAMTARVFERSKVMSREETAELKAVFDSFDVDRSGSISAEEFSSVLTALGLNLAEDKVLSMLKAADLNGNGSISFDEFVKAVERCKTNTSLHSFAEVITKQKATVMQVKRDNVVHSFDEEECAAFIDFINTKLSASPELAYLLPITELPDLFTSVADGVLLCKLINIAVPDTIDERVINVAPRNPFHVTENHNLALNAAKSIGLTVVNIGSSDLVEGRPHLVLGLIWQMVKMALLSNINLKACPFLVRLLEGGETLEQLLKLPPEKLLLRWINYHLAQANHPKRISNFGSDLKDSDVYCHLLQQIDPERLANTGVLKNSDLHKRAEYVVAQGSRLGAEFTVQPTDIVKGNEKLNLGFVAALFNAAPGLEPPAEEEVLKLMEELPDDDGGDSREERAFRMWLNSLGIKSYVNNLFDDLRDGIALLQTMDHVQPGVVDWGRVNSDCRNMVFKKVENLNYAVDLGKEGFVMSLVGVQGKDIVDGNRKLTLAIIWQLFRYHLVGFLTSLRKAGSGSGAALSDDDIARWASDQVASSSSTTSPPPTMRDFHDKSLASGLFLIELLAAVEPRCIDRSLVTAGGTEEERMMNAKYAISAARKLGCSLFLLWEDIVEVRPKMILSFVASVMATALSAGPSTSR